MTLPAPYFEQLYQQDSDPWKITGRWYEIRKRAIGLAVLPKESFTRAFEPGCGNGDLTVLLALRCDELISWDTVPAAVARATEATAAHPNVLVQQGSVPTDWPSGAFDLIVLSELCYYLADLDLARLLERTTETLRPGGVVLATHWRHDAPGYPLTGDAVHARLLATEHLARTAAYEDDDVLIDVLVKTPPAPVSVAGHTAVLAPQQM